MCLLDRAGSRTVRRACGAGSRLSQATLGPSRPHGPTIQAGLTDPVTIDDTPEALLAAFCERDWCDGLPIVPPTEERVQAMLGGARRPIASLGVMPPLWRQATLEKLAVNAVMAGCEPAYFPLIVAAVQAMLEPVVQPLRRPGDDALGGAAPDRARSDRRRARRARRQRLLRSRLSRQRDDRPGDPADPHERRGRLARPARHGDPGKPREVLLLHRRARGRLALGSAPRGRRRHGVRRRAAAQRERSRVDDRRRHSRDRGRHGGLARLERRLVLLAEPALDRAGPGARADDREGRVSAATTSSGSCSSTRGCRSGR